jgi:SAM-dependent methyltransferase
MSHGFDKDYWESHWRASGSSGGLPPNPYVMAETGGLVPGTALDAGCGEGAEALWLAAQGWRVTAADISSETLARARRRADDSPGSASVDWLEADLGVWHPQQPFDLVTTHYAHPSLPQLDFYERISEWVAPGGTLLVVGHLLAPGTDGHDHQASDRHGRDDHSHATSDGHPPEVASVTAARVTARLDPARWTVVTAEEPVRTVEGGERPRTLHDVVVRATRAA